VDYHTPLFQQVDRTKLSDWGNIDIGDCTFAHQAAAIALMTAVTGAALICPTPVIVGAYSACTGYVPGNPATDNGYDIDSALEYWQAKGYQIADQRLDVLTGAANVDFHDISGKMHDALAECGPLSLGVALPNAYKTTANWASAPNGAWVGNLWAPGGWGLHAMTVGYHKRSAGLWKGLSWGQEITITDAAMAGIVDEAQALLSLSSWFTTASRTPSGLNFAGLQAAWRAVT
jgi:hypothetical protein